MKLVTPQNFNPILHTNNELENLLLKIAPPSRLSRSHNNSTVSLRSTLKVTAGVGEVVLPSVDERIIHMMERPPFIGSRLSQASSCEFRPSSKSFSKTKSNQIDEEPISKQVNDAGGD